MCGTSSWLFTTLYRCEAAVCGGAFGEVSSALPPPVRRWVVVLAVLELRLVVVVYYALRLVVVVAWEFSLRSMAGVCSRVVIPPPARVASA